MDEGGDGVDDQVQVALVRTQSLFSLLAIIDVGQEQIPGGYRTFRIPHRQAANLEPPVNAVSASATVLDFIDLPGFDGFGACLDDARKIIRMNGADEGPVLQLLICLAEILQDLPVEKLHFAHRAHRGHEPGNVVDDLPPGEFARTQGLLATLAILDVDIGSEPPGDASRLIAQGVCAKQEPSIGAVVTAHACFRVHWQCPRRDTIANARRVPCDRPDESPAAQPEPAACSAVIPV